MQWDFNAAYTLIGGLIGGGGVWGFLKVRSAARAKLARAQLHADGHRDDNDLQREAAAITALKERVAAMEVEMAQLKHDAHVYRRVSHDMAGVANAARLVLVTKFIEVNQILVSNGKPEKYPDPVKAAMEAIDTISGAIVGERQALYDKAERLERLATLQQAAADKQKETITRTDDFGPDNPSPQVLL
jgi:hypothetical protein